MQMQLKDLIDLIDFAAKEKLANSKCSSIYKDIIRWWLNIRLDKYIVFLNFTEFIIIAIFDLNTVLVQKHTAIFQYIILILNTFSP